MLRRIDMNRCDQCNGRFGLIRYRLARKCFCSKHCLNAYRADTDPKLARFKGWIDFVHRKA